MSGQRLWERKSPQNDHIWSARRSEIIILDSGLTFQSNINSVVKIVCYYLGNIPKFKSFLSQEFSLFAHNDK